MSTIKEFQDYGLPCPDANSKETIQANINYLYDKISQVSKNTTFWDLYKISAVVTEKNSLKSIVSSLVPFTSAIINTPTGFNDGDRYSVGDVILKNSDGTTTHIEAERGGIFFPYEITRSGSGSYTYNIKFMLKNAEPSAESSIIKGSSNSWDASNSYAKTVVYEGLNGGVAASPYNKVFKNPNSSMTFDAAYVGTTPINPIIKCYNNDGEEIYEDLTIELKLLNGINKYVITKPSCSMISTVVVK